MLLVVSYYQGDSLKMTYKAARILYYDLNVI